MTSKKHRKIMYGVAIHLLLISVICYAAFPVTAPDEPIRLMYQTNVGNVIFDHQTHAADTGFGLDCFDCHHHGEDEDLSIVACGQCHPVEPNEGQVPEYCLECHDSAEIEDAEDTPYTEYAKRSKAIHRQCTQCHLEFGKGPLHDDEKSLGKEEKEKLKTQPNEWADCNKCHIK